MTEFDKKYQKLLSDIMEHGIAELNQRTGHETKALPGLSFSVDLEKDGFPLLSLRKIPIRIFVAEQIWFLSGSRRPDDFLRDYTKIWDDFTNPNDVVTVAYGYRWRKHFGRDQIGKLVELLEKDPSSRHGVVVAWDPASDGLGGVVKKNVPCMFAFTVTIIGGRLHMLNIVRSNAHIYDIHYEAAREIIGRTTNQKKVVLTLPDQAFDRAERKDPELAEEIIKNLTDQYTPGEPIKGMKIVL